jgi:serine/threonine protein phosphatase PrpC
MPALPEWITASVAKRGNRVQENEDAHAAAPDGLRFAVADGATEGWESGPWAAHLVRAYTAGPLEPAQFADWLASARNWSAPPSAGEDNQAWYVTEKEQEGSFATLLGLELRSSRLNDGWFWRAIAVGDTCLFQIRDRKAVLAFPIKSAKGFGNRPDLLGSAATSGSPQPKWSAGRAAPGDLLLLATDAAAARLFDRSARRAALDVVGAALAARTPDALTEWCQSVQDIKNDDVTLLAIRLPAENNTEPENEKHEPAGDSPSE